MRLFHFSEEADIGVFRPRPPLAHPEQEPLVWAIDDWHSPHYFVPRDCPRVCFWARPQSEGADIQHFLGEAPRAVAVERGWQAALREAVLYRYEFDPSDFELVDETAGYFVSRVTVRPLAVERLSSLPALFPAAGVELRPVDDLLGLQLAVVGSTLAFSSMRLRNADDERAASYR